ncbi:hypothetical protein ACJJID_16400 [Microbulbifer sp. CnH-101-G]|uniref:hypothetical protein n=1 Tax=Microbulbifer sp. CnH-101-G TaxID=3243393 RepID=UPI004039EA90
MFKGLEAVRTFSETLYFSGVFVELDFSAEVLRVKIRLGFERSFYFSPEHIFLPTLFLFSVFIIFINYFFTHKKRATQWVALSD